MGEILRVEGLTVSFSGFKAINGLNLTVDEGELRVIIGPNGAGKTTLMDLITGRTPVTSGRIMFREHDITRLEIHERAALGIGRKFQVPNVYENLTVADNLRVAAQGPRGILNALRRSTTRHHQGLVEILDLIHLSDAAHALAHSLSHGQRQWLEIGMVLAQTPDLIILDEPTAGMTREETLATADLITAMAERQTLIVVEHDMEFVRRVARRITVLHQGQLLAEGNVAEVEANPKVVEVYLGRERLVHAS